MSPRDQAAAIFRCIRGDSVAIKQQRDNYKALCASITSPNGGLRITSSTVNNQMFKGENTISAQEQLNVLSLLMVMLDKDSAGSKSVTAVFY
jgi:hypothetical protein